MTEYLSCAKTAKLLRQALQAQFPGVKFSVRSKTYSGGASIDVRWTDGPTHDAVNSVARQFSGAGFDGMIDLKYHKTSWLLPDGSVMPAHCSGTKGSMGVVPAHDVVCVVPGAKEVSFGADYVFCHRDLSEAFRDRVMAIYRAATPEERGEILEMTDAYRNVRNWPDGGFSHHDEDFSAFGYDADTVRRNIESRLTGADVF